MKPPNQDIVLTDKIITLIQLDQCINFISNTIDRIEDDMTIYSNVLETLKKSKSYLLCFYKDDILDSKD